MGWFAERLTGVERQTDKFVPSLLSFAFNRNFPERIREFIGYFKTPRLAGHQFSIDIFDRFAGNFGRLFPSRLTIRQLFALMIAMRVRSMENIEVISRHVMALSKCSR